MAGAMDMAAKLPKIKDEEREGKVSSNKCLDFLFPVEAPSCQVDNHVYCCHLLLGLRPN